jgi:CRP-like cAMP-binding protein
LVALARSHRYRGEVAAAARAMTQALRLWRGTVDELRELLGRHARPDLSTAIDGVRICKADHAASPESSMFGTVLAVVA